MNLRDAVLAYIENLKQLGFSESAINGSLGLDLRHLCNAKFGSEISDTAAVHLSRFFDPFSPDYAFVPKSEPLVLHSSDGSVIDESTD